MLVVGEGEGERNTPARTNLTVRLENPFKFWTAVLIGAVIVSITSCQSKANFSSGSFVATQMKMWGSCKAWIRHSKKIFLIFLDWEYCT